MMSMFWAYERLDEDGNTQFCPAVDADGSVTGHIVIGVKQWFDENPEERIRLGWTKHIKWDVDEIKEKWPYDSQTQTLVHSVRQVDEHTIEDVYHVLDKSEEMMLMEELFMGSGLYLPTAPVILDAHGGVVV